MTELPCLVCGKPVFQRTKRRRRYCSPSCNWQAWRETHPNAPRSGTPGHDPWRSCTITVRMPDGGLRSFVGQGETRLEAHKHALAQAAVLGEFEEVSYVTTRKILIDLERETA